MLEDAFRNEAQPVAGLDFIADLGGRGEFPGLLHVEGGQIFSALQKISALGGQVVKRVLQSVVGPAQKARAQFGAQQFAREFDSVALLQSAGVLVDLQVGVFAADPDNFRLQALVANHGVSHLVLDHLVSEFDGDDVAVDGSNSSN